MQEVFMFESRYLEFDQIGSTGKTDIWDVRSKSQGSVLGEIKWFGRWRQYCFWPSPNTIFNPECMADISKVIKELMARRGNAA
jgi:hypothetical protein